ncbi:MAG: segregation/condensation protein A [Puniceicoccales bacterium]|jgi:segregation and condensation protein A|nr:segregation/condensation protein A [Puniceicoccales bacterium]
MPEADNTAAEAAAPAPSDVNPPDAETAETAAPAAPVVSAVPAAPAAIPPPPRDPAADGLLPPPDHPIRLPAFEGPLDLLLYLIRKNEIDIYDIPIETVTRQYLEVLRTSERNNLEVAGDFFVMAATLMYIKSRMLLPADTPAAQDPAEGESDKEHDLDPRWELVQQLVQYKKIKECAGHLDALIIERQGYLARLVSAMPDSLPESERPLAPGDRIEIWNTFNRILQRFSDRIAPGEIHGETVTIASRMEDILERLEKERRFAFSSLFEGIKPTVAQLVSTFLACLELARLGKLSLAQNELFDEIYCDAVGGVVGGDGGVDGGGGGEVVGETAKAAEAGAVTAVTMAEIAAAIAVIAPEAAGAEEVGNEHATEATENSLSGDTGA